MHRLPTKVLDVSNAFQNTNVPIHDRVCVSPPPCYIDWFEISYSNFHLNRNYGPFYPQCMDGIQGTKPDGKRWNRLLDVLVTIIKYKKITIDHAIYIKVFYYLIVYYLTVFTDDVSNTNNIETAFPEQTIFFEEQFDMKVQE